MVASVQLRSDEPLGACVQLFPYIRTMTAKQELAQMKKLTGWSMYELAKQAKLPKSTVTRIAKGTDPKNSTMEKLRKAVAKHMATES